MGKNLTLKTVNKAIKAKYPEINLIRDNGYFYIASDNDDLSLQLNALHTTSIYVARISHQPIERWVSDVEALLRDESRLPLDRLPVTFYKLDQDQ